ncbi:MAG: hypothetical protein COV75_08795 [Candidatus Omnitrophica bacterium CG11_big_fil_rev_8_21_14_0_20_63_9]|nr:MAG: hypothetical protein COV75_08795 [Candidatus Omnitrophica bacterium CG11_big_fil_rev_8_21_14_0_20_63_9]
MATVPQPASASGPSERRQAPRYHMALDAVCGPLASDGRHPADHPLERTVTVNLSEGGLCVYSAQRYPIGAQLYCAITLPGQAKPVEISGTVAWFQKSDDGEFGYKLGLEFGPLSAEVRQTFRTLFESPLPKAASSRAKKLLLVDDDPDLRHALKLRFESAGFEVVTAADGLEALRKGREEHPNIILLDLMLPTLTGFDVCRLLKFDPKFRHIPVILFTAKSREDDMRTGYAVGADAYVTKPFDGKGLIEKVEELLAGSRDA